MPEDSFLSLQQAQTVALTTALRKSNTLSERYGLTLSDAQIVSLASAQREVLHETGRMEFGTGILPKLIYAFCDSPYVDHETYYDTLLALQELFYTFKNELYDALSDDELVEAMQRIFNGWAQGSLEALENVTNSDLARALRGEGREDDGND